MVIIADNNRKTGVNVLTLVNRLPIFVTILVKVSQNLKSNKISFQSPIQRFTFTPNSYLFSNNC